MQLDKMSSQDSNGSPHLMDSIVTKIIVKVNSSSELLQRWHGF